MPDFQTFLLFLAAALVVAITPGPGIFYIQARTLEGGRTQGLASSVGLGLGGLVHIFGGAVGISALVMASAEAFMREPCISSGLGSIHGAKRA
jgi:threonine/homoserine/homoserine lactone efflux protein